MAWVPLLGYRTWTCSGCGALRLAVLLDACPHCGTGREGAAPAAEPAEDAESAAAAAPVAVPRKRTRTRTTRTTAARGGQ